MGLKGGTNGRTLQIGFDNMDSNLEDAKESDNKMKGYESSIGKSG